MELTNPRTEGYFASFFLWKQHITVIEMFTSELLHLPFFFFIFFLQRKGSLQVSFYEMSLSLFYNRCRETISGLGVLLISSPQINKDQFSTQPFNSGL